MNSFGLCKYASLVTAHGHGDRFSKARSMHNNYIPNTSLPKELKLCFGMTFGALINHLSATVKQDFDFPEDAKVEEIKDSVLMRVLADRIGPSFKYRRTELKKVIWLLPPTGYIKLNCDGSMNPEDVGYGGIARNEHGQVIFAYTGGGYVHSILFQELKAIEVGIKLCVSLELKRIIVSLDSLQAVQMLRGIETTPWTCWNLVASIKKLMLSVNKIAFLHVYREENRAAYYLAKLSLGAIIWNLLYFQILYVRL
ncbi:hypothetical protein IFM89_033401 [Coptis chinensis]|uniref:RNase H type-1 domain-containing protein n=1 Tax=Coptis chinensis TaxID=261450 RepID=A0A835LXV7_9MAGN|nr:hypothetical protein IFM89_033401 [Coptis chinensis]